MRRRSFWAVLMELAAAGVPRYVEYSHAQRADCFRLELTVEAAAALRANADTLKYSALETRIRAAVLEEIDFYVARAG
jgi:hypothetical protein